MIQQRRQRHWDKGGKQAALEGAAGTVLVGARNEHREP